MQAQMNRPMWTPTCSPRRTTRTAEIRVGITCRVCSTVMQVAITNEVLLCEVCRSDPGKAYIRLDQRIKTALECFCGTLHSATSLDQDRYDVVCMARRATQGKRKYDMQYQASVLRRTTTAMAQRDGLSTILHAEAALFTTLRVLELARDELRYAMEIEQL